MFDVVNDIENYPRFLPWCKAARVISESEGASVAELTIARGGITQSFTTRNELDRPNSMKLDLVEGPFTRLRGEWRFEQLGDAGSKVALRLEFELDSRVAGYALGKVFGSAADTMVDAFCDRAESVYGS